MPDIFTIATIASTALGAVSTIQQGRASAAAGAYQARAAEQNARVAEQLGALEEDRQRRKLARALGTQRTRILGGGVQLEGSPLLTMADGAGEGEIDALTTRHRAGAEAFQLRQQATLSRFRGEQDERSAYLRAGSSLLSDIGKMRPRQPGLSSDPY